MYLRKATPGVIVDTDQVLPGVLLTMTRQAGWWPLSPTRQIRRCISLTHQMNMTRGAKLLRSGQTWTKKRVCCQSSLVMLRAVRQPTDDDRMCLLLDKCMRADSHGQVLVM